MAPKNLLITEDLIEHLKAAFPLKPYEPGMALEEVAYNQGTQAPIDRLEHLLQMKTARGK